MKKKFESKNIIKIRPLLPKINLNSNIISSQQRRNIDNKNKIIFSKSSERNTTKYNKINSNKNNEIGKIEKLNNKINDIISNLNKKSYISNKINTSIRNDSKRKIISSFFVDDFNRKRMLTIYNNKKKVKEIEKTKNIENNNIQIFQKKTKEKLRIIESKKDKGLIQELKNSSYLRKSFENNKEEKHSNKKNKINLYDLDFRITINPKKVIPILEDCGIINSYNYLINNIKLVDCLTKQKYLNSSNIKNWSEGKYNEKQREKKNKNYFKNKKENLKHEKTSDNIQLTQGLYLREKNKFKKKLNKISSYKNIVEKNKTSLDDVDNDISKNNEKINFKYNKINIQFINGNNKINSRNFKFFYNNKIAKSKSNININDSINGKLLFKIGLNKNEKIKLENNNHINLHKSYDSSVENKLLKKIINLRKLFHNK